MQPGKPQSQEAKPESNVDDRKRFQSLGYVAHEHEVTVFGRTLNEEGEPVVGARVFVIAVIPTGVPFRKLPVPAEAKSDGNGNYHFDKVKLSVLEFAPKAVPKPSEALFKVFALADGYGYVWRRTHGFRPERRPIESDAPAKPVDKTNSDGKQNAVKSQKNDVPQHVFFADEPIVLDLEFSPEVRLHGTLSDDLGNPLKNAVAQIRSSQYLEDSLHGVDGQLSGISALPEEFRVARTDGEGRYEIRGLPRDCSLLVDLDYLPEYDRWIDRIHTGKVAPPTGRFVGYAGELNHVFVAPVTVRVKALGRNRQPLANVVVREESGGQIRRAGSLDRTDAGGTATLKLRPGKCALIVEPTIGQPYLPQQLMLEFKDDPRECSIEVELNSAAEVIFEAVEKETGKPIAGIAFLSEPADARDRKPVQSQLSFVDHLRTDASGRMQAFFEPGERQFFVDQRRSPAEFEPLAPVTETFDLSPDKPTRLRLEFTRRPAVVTEDKPAPITDELKPLVELLQRQSERFERSRNVRYQVRHNNHVRADMTREQLTQVLESLASKTVDECLEALRNAFPDFGGLGAAEILTDGIRRRVEIHYPGYDQVDFHVFNGEETIVSMAEGRQLHLFDREDNTQVHYLEPRDFWEGPANPRVLTLRKQPAGADEPRRTVRHADGAWEVEVVTPRFTTRWIIDDTTAFQRRVSSVTARGSGRETWQFFPTLMSTGVAYPKLSIEANRRDENLAFCTVTFVDKVELLDVLPAEAFVVAARAGTNIVDYRGIPRSDQRNGRRPPTGVVSADVPDVVAHRNRLAPAGEPVLKIGDGIPELNVLTWVNAEGKIDRPSLAGKVIVIDFWGIGCGPCVAQLPEVNAAAKHFADSKIIIVGLHDSSGGLEQVTQFAQKRGLVFPMAIDNPDPKSQSFGITFASFGISAIPSAVVVDSIGRVVYLGQFQQAIEIANKLIQAK